MMSNGFGTKTKTAARPVTGNATSYDIESKNQLRRTVMIFLAILSVTIVGFGLFMVLTHRLSFGVVMFGIFIYAMTLSLVERLLK